MGLYLNPGNAGFKESVNSQIYVDKTGLIQYANEKLETRQKYICVSRPRRFGKSMAADMLSAYYDCSCDSRDLFKQFKIAESPTFENCLNKYNVIALNMTEFKSAANDCREMIEIIEAEILDELIEKFQFLNGVRRLNLVKALKTVYSKAGEQFVFIIDEWDCIFREKKDDHDYQVQYLDFLRNLLKDQTYVVLAYMTGILPIKKYGTHSALNMFDEFSMTNARELSEYVGFTEPEVKKLCADYNMDFDEAKRWYDGYRLLGTDHIYSPKSVVSAMLSQHYDSYWNSTETYEALRVYITMNFDNLKDIVIDLLMGNRRIINTAKFTNDMTTFNSADDVLTLLIHLGYLAYDAQTKEVFIPNSEVAGEFANAVEDSGWSEVADALKQSDELLKATLQEDADKVAKIIEQCHLDTSILTYNNENSLLQKQQ